MLSRKTVSFVDASSDVVARDGQTGTDKPSHQLFSSEPLTKRDEKEVEPQKNVVHKLPSSELLTGKVKMESSNGLTSFAQVKPVFGGKAKPSHNPKDKQVDFAGANDLEHMKTHGITPYPPVLTEEGASSSSPETVSESSTTTGNDFELESSSKFVDKSLGHRVSLNLSDLSEGDEGSYDGSAQSVSLDETRTKLMTNREVEVVQTSKTSELAYAEDSYQAFKAFINTSVAGSPSPFSTEEVESPSIRKSMPISSSESPCINQSGQDLDGAAHIEAQCEPGGKLRSKVFKGNGVRSVHLKNLPDNLKDLPQSGSCHRTRLWYRQKVLPFWKITAAQIVCVMYILVLTFSPTPIGMKDPITNNIIDIHNDDNTSKGVIYVNGSFRPIVAIGGWQKFYLAISRMSAFSMYPMMVAVLVTKIKLCNRS